METEKKVLTTGEAAKWCGVSLVTVLRWIRKGRLKAYSLPGRGDHRIRMEDFTAFLVEYGIPGPSPSGKHPRVLVVDDDPTAVKLITMTLRDLGYETQQALDGFAAGAQLFAFGPDLVTLDLTMPGLGGHQVIEFIRASEQLRHIKILVVSGASAPELKRAVLAGADGALQKPLDYKALEKKAAELLGPARVASAQEPEAAGGPRGARSARSIGKVKS